MYIIQTGYKVDKFLAVTEFSDFKLAVIKSLVLELRVV